MLNDYISLMADKTSDLETRQYYKKQALYLFAGRGYEYQKDDIRKEGALITIYSANKTRPRKRLDKRRYQSICLHLLFRPDFHRLQRWYSYI